MLLGSMYKGHCTKGLLFNVMLAPAFASKSALIKVKQSWPLKGLYVRAEGFVRATENAVISMHEMEGGFPKKPSLHLHS